MRVFLALVLTLLSARARAASIVLSGPTTIHVGQTASYSLQLSLEPGETLGGVVGQFLVEGGRSLASFTPDYYGQLGSRGFLVPYYWVDLAALSEPASTLYQYPVLLQGELETPYGCTPACNILGRDYTASEGPFTIVPFTLTAVAQGDLLFEAPPTNVLYPFFTPTYPSVEYYFTPTAGQGGTVDMFPPADGVWARIHIVPEPSSSALCALGLAAALALMRVTRVALSR